MPNIIEGKLDAKGLRVGLLVSRFNSFVSDRLVEGAIDALLRHGAEKEDIHVVRVPGAFEIPPAAKQMAESGRFDAIVCLGAVIRGATAEYLHVGVVLGELDELLRPLPLHHQFAALVQTIPDDRV